MKALHAWDWGGETEVARHDIGLINQTFLVRIHGEVAAILQRLNTDIFVPQVHEDIEAVTAHLATAGLATPRLIRTRSGALWHTDGSGQVWRCLTPVGDRTVEKLADPADAESAGELVARFHAAIAGFSWDFRSVRSGAHDIVAHMDKLSVAVDAHRAHRLWWDVASLTETILAGWQQLELPTGLPVRIIHGDLKISNVRFAGPSARALIDLDTFAHSTLDIELGDAMRSWCNPASEDSTETRFDVDLFSAAMRGYARGAGEGLTEAEWASIVPGVERICWELSARFAQDALAESYFGWDEKYGSRGAHNLLRARGQVALAKSVRAQRQAAEAALRDARMR